jgi:branched-chain amino acid transport system permease protein
MFCTLAQFYNIIYGFVGLFNFGYAAFFGIGAYTSAILATDLNFPIIISMIIATLFSAICGFIIMIPCLRMHGFTTGIVTLAFGEIIRILIIASNDLTNGEMGYWGIKPMFTSDQAYALFAVIMVIVTTVGIESLMRTKVGLAFRIIHDDAQAAQSIGNNVSGYKLLAMSISCAGAGFVGAFYAHYLLTITPALCGMSYTVQILCLALFGGVGTILGPVIGGLSLTVLTESLRFLNDYRMLIYGILLVVVIMFYPKGIMGIIEGIRERGKKGKVKNGGNEYA